MELFFHCLVNLKKGKSYFWEISTMAKKVFKENPVSPGMNQKLLSWRIMYGWLIRGFKNFGVLISPFNYDKGKSFISKKKKIFKPGLLLLLK
ncbi:MAG: hypothetical protein CM15mP22_0420 [Gammaproteobacteria bacterium]|nr:MAG: hypothetical protein CM15mP22_0420 [Gammaproteobacteria bacterium]